MRPRPKKSLKGLPRATHCKDRAQTSGNVTPTVELCPSHPTFGTKVRARRGVPEEKKKNEIIHLHIIPGTVFCLIAGRSLAGDRTNNNRHLGTIGSIPRVTIHPHIYNSDNPGTNTDIAPGLIPPRTVWISPTPPTGRSLTGWGSYIIEPAPPGDDRVPSPVQGSFHISES